jgi:Protein of unknown function (DUF4235)
MKILFIPLSVIGGLLAGAVGKKAFARLWSWFDSEAAPEPDQRGVSWQKLIAALVLQGATFRAVRGPFDRGSREVFRAKIGGHAQLELPVADEVVETLIIGAPASSLVSTHEERIDAQISGTDRQSENSGEQSGKDSITRDRLEAERILPRDLTERGLYPLAYGRRSSGSLTEWHSAIVSELASAAPRDSGLLGLTQTVAVCP